MIELDSNLPNFRQVYPRSDCPKAGGKLYRASRPDFLTDSYLQYLVDKFDLRSFVDFRSASEYKRASGPKNIDKFFQVRKVKCPFRFAQKDAVSHIAIRKQLRSVQSQSQLSDYDSNNLSQEQREQLRRIKSNSDIDNVRHIQRNHYLIDFFKLNYVAAVFLRARWWLMIYSLLYILYDLLMFTGFKHFVRLFVRHVLNPVGLTQSYKDMIEHSQPGICAAFKLLADPDNIPACLNCAHGKDRTGIVSALVLLLMGVPRDEIIKDYAASTDHLKCIEDRIYEETVVKYHWSKDFMACREETMDALLAFIFDKYGNVTDYLLSIGVSAQQIEMVKRNLSSPESENDIS